VATETLTAAGELVQENPQGALWVTPKGLREEIQLHDIVGFGRQRLPETTETGDEER
jgi:hypothetical protein